MRCIHDIAFKGKFVSLGKCGTCGTSGGRLHVHAEQLFAIFHECQLILRMERMGTDIAPFVIPSHKIDIAAHITQEHPPSSARNTMHSIPSKPPLQA